MVDPKWHSELHRALVRQGLPRPYRERLMDELLDHAISLQEETAGMDAVETDTVKQKVGEPKQLAQLAGEEYRKRTWLGRHPVVAFLIAPIPMLVLSWILSMLLLVIPGKILQACGVATDGFTSSSLSATTVQLLNVGHYLWAVSPFILTSFWACWIARRTGRGPRWLFACCAVITLVAAAYESHTVLPAAPGKGMLTVGFGLPPWRTTTLPETNGGVLLSTRQTLLGQLLLIALPAAICGLSVWRHSRNTPQPPALTYGPHIPVGN